MGFDPDLTAATRMALKQMIRFVVDEKRLDRDSAYALTSVAADLHITQLVDGNVGVHCLLPKNVFTGG